MDWNKAIQYAQLVNAAYDVFAGKTPVTPGYDWLATLYANDLATDSNFWMKRSRLLPVEGVRRTDSPTCTDRCLWRRGSAPCLL